MQQLSYGTMPSFTEWEAAFERVCPNGYYTITLSVSDAAACEPFRLCEGWWMVHSLYDACREITTKWAAERCTDETLTDAALNVVSCILFTLGWEWV